MLVTIKPHRARTKITSRKRFVIFVFLSVSSYFYFLLLIITQLRITSSYIVAYACKPNGKQENKAVVLRLGPFVVCSVVRSDSSHIVFLFFVVLDLCCCYYCFFCCCFLFKSAIF